MFCPAVGPLRNNNKYVVVLRRESHTHVNMRNTRNMLSCRFVGAAVEDTKGGASSWENGGLHGDGQKEGHVQSHGHVEGCVLCRDLFSFQLPGDQEMEEKCSGECVQFTGPVR